MLPFIQSIDTTAEEEKESETSYSKDLSSSSFDQNQQTKDSNSSQDIIESEEVKKDQGLLSTDDMREKEVNSSQIFKGPPSETSPQINIKDSSSETFGSLVAYDRSGSSSSSNEDGID